VTTLTICRGLPASGKTTYARDLVQRGHAAGRRISRVNRDDLRAMHFGYDGHGVDETAVTAAQHAAIGALLAVGSDVVCDDTNLASRYVRALMETAERSGAAVVIADQFLAVPVDECVRRDAERAPQYASVGESVIRGMHQRYLAGRSTLTVPVLTPPVAAELYVPSPDTPAAVLVDIDGTLALMNGRSPYDWSRVGEDALNVPVALAVEAFAAQGHTIVVMSGRDGSCRAATEAWLAKNGIPYDELHMRAAGDTRRDSVVKLELFDAHVRHRFTVLCVLDDRDQVVRAWRSIGLTCLQVAEGNF